MCTVLSKKVPAEGPIEHYNSTVQVREIGYPKDKKLRHSLGKKLQVLVTYPKKRI